MTDKLMQTPGLTDEEVRSYLEQLEGPFEDHQDCNMITLTVTEEEAHDIVSALSYTAEDYAERASFEDKFGGEEKDEFLTNAEDYGKLNVKISEQMKEQGL